MQELKFGAHNIRYLRARYQLPDGSFVTTPLPERVDGHFGPTLRSYVLYQHYQNHVTQPLLLEELREVGVDISAGQINRLLNEGHDAFHREKDGLLPAARDVSQSNIGCWHLNQWISTLVELCCWDMDKSTLIDRRDRPWDNAQRRPSHADRRRSISREMLGRQFLDVLPRSPEHRKLRTLFHDLIVLAA